MNGHHPTLGKNLGAGTEPGLQATWHLYLLLRSVPLRVSKQGSPRRGARKILMLSMSKYEDSGSSPPKFWPERRLAAELSNTIRRADLGATRGVVHQLRVGPFADQSEARALCETLKKRGTDCFVVAPRNRP